MIKIACNDFIELGKYIIIYKKDDYGIYARLIDNEFKRRTTDMYYNYISIRWTKYRFIINTFDKKYRNDNTVDYRREQYNGKNWQLSLVDGFLCKIPTNFKSVLDDNSYSFYLVIYTSLRKYLITDIAQYIIKGIFNDLYLNTEKYTIL